MSQHSDGTIPVLTDIVADKDNGSTLPSDIDILVAELQTRLAADTFALTEALVRTAFAEMEAHLLEQVSTKLRQSLPELIDSVLREHLDADSSPQD